MSSAEHEPLLVVLPVRQGDRVTFRDSDYEGTVLRVLDPASVLVAWKGGSRTWHAAIDLRLVGRGECCYQFAPRGMVFAGDVRCEDV